MPRRSTGRARRDRFALLITAALVGCYAGGSARDPDDDHEDDGGSSDDGSFDGPPVCVDTKNFFREKLWGPLLKAKCLACHNPEGAAKASHFILQDTDFPGYLEVNYQTVQNLARLEIDGVSLLLLKPMGMVEHGGGQQLATDSDAYADMLELLERIDAPVHCVDDADITAFYRDLELLDEAGTLRKAVFLLANRLPTEAELAAVRGKGMDALDPVLDAVMHEEAFYGRLKEIYNDILHTDAYLVGDDAVDTVDADMFPNARWYDALPDDDIAAARNATNDAIAREPLELVAWVARNDRPFSEILTAPFTMVNPWSARSYGVSLDHFTDPGDPTEFRPVAFDGIPHSGLLTTSVFLNRYPTTPTNRNRARARVFFDFFLATDVLRLASRPIDATSVTGFNPTLNDPACQVCHDGLDPVAGVFQAWDELGRFRPSASGWYPDMRPPGYGEALVPFEQGPHALQWMMPTFVEDPKFALSVVHTLFTGLTGQEPLVEPLDEHAPDYLQRIRAFEAQDHRFAAIAQSFVDADMEVRVAVRELVKSEWFRAVDSTVPLSAERASELADMGSARLLPPEALHRRILATVGIPWRRDNVDVLLSTNYFRFFYGGIDSASVTVRLTEMNGVMANIAERMANEVACAATASDLTLAPLDRKLLPLVEPGDLPGTPAGDAMIRANVMHLHEQLLGESLHEDDPEIDRTVELFMAVYDNGRAQLSTGTASPELPAPCQAVNDRATGMPLPAGSEIITDPDFTIRAWMATVAYLLGDVRFLYE